MKKRTYCLLFVCALFLTNFDGCHLGGGGDSGKQAAAACPNKGEVCCQTWDHGINPANPSAAEYSCHQSSDCSLMGGTPVSANFCHK
jgi:hypothetical protein